MLPECPQLRLNYIFCECGVSLSLSLAETLGKAVDMDLSRLSLDSAGTATARGGPASARAPILSERPEAKEGSEGKALKLADERNWRRARKAIDFDVEARVEEGYHLLLEDAKEDDSGEKK